MSQCPCDMKNSIWKRMRERMVHGLFSFPHTRRYENDVLLCAGNDANRTAEKFLHNSIQFLLNPNGECLCQEEAEMTETKREGSRLWWRKRGWRLSVKQWRNGESERPGSLKGAVRGGSGSLERSRSGRNYIKKKKKTVRRWLIPITLVF